MKTFRYLAAAAAALLLLAGCTGQMKTATVSDNGTVLRYEGSEAALNYEYEMEYITGGIDEAVMDRINNYIIRKNVFDDDSMTDTDVPAACQRWADELVGSYGSGAEGREGEDGMFNWDSTKKGRFTTACKARKLQSYCMDEYQALGGVHGEESSFYTVFDLNTGEPVTEEAFIIDDCGPEIEELLRKKAGSGGKDAGSSVPENPVLNGNFSVSDDGVTWHYNPYETGVQAAGVIDIFLRWDELEAFLK
ncbi:MAG: RsiV family protein [Bacteroidales bacterium]|nr:RsiV family protein [Bacteroidales bacterium]